MSGSSGIAYSLQPGRVRMQWGSCGGRGPAVSAEDSVVNEAGGADPGCYREEGARCGGFYGFQSDPVDQLDVVDADCGLGGEGLAGGFYQRAGAAFAGCNEGSCLADYAAEDEGLVAFGGAEVEVAGAEGQAVGLADDGADDDFGGQGQIGRHAAEDGKLGGGLLGA